MLMIFSAGPLNKKRCVVCPHNSVVKSAKSVHKLYYWSLTKLANRLGTADTDIGDQELQGQKSILVFRAPYR